MPTPVAYTTGSQVGAALLSASLASGYTPSSLLSAQDQANAILANFLLGNLSEAGETFSSRVTVTAGGIGVTGDSTITGALDGVTTLTATTFVGALTGNVTGNVSGTAATVTTAAQPAITSVGTLSSLAVGAGITFVTSASSTTALATPSAFAATKGSLFASTVSGATLMGFGTTGDVTLKNRAGTDVVVVTSNTTGVTMAGALAITGALSGVTTLATSSTINSQTISASASLTGTLTTAGALTVNAASQHGTAAGTDLTTIGGTGYGAGVASLRMNGLSTAAVTNQTGTLLNAPVAGNPAFWMPISIAGTVRYVPCW